VACPTGSLKDHATALWRGVTSLYGVHTHLTVDRVRIDQSALNTFGAGEAGLVSAGRHGPPFSKMKGPGAGKSRRAKPRAISILSLGC